MEIHKKIGLALRSLPALLLVISLSGCIGLVPSPFRPSPGPKQGPHVHDLAEAFDVVCRNYRLGPDDVLQLNYQTEWNIPAGSYKLDSLDVVDVYFPLLPQEERRLESLIIRPDGMISVPGIGDVKAAGLSPEQLAKDIERRLRDADIFREGGEPGRARKRYQLCTVSVRQFYQKVNELVKSLTTLTSGQQSQVVVKPDGTIDLPLLRDRVLAAGHTVREVENTVNRLYRDRVFKHVVASIALAQAKSRKVYVLGQVKNPGAYELRQPITAVHAIALAGGHSEDTADLTSVILISKDAYGKPIGRRLDLKKMFDVGDMSSAILVKPYDVIFVPRTYVGDLRLFMSQYFASAADVVKFLVDVGNVK
ncbi:MAG: polysaccharide biosynthesis/export family protein [Thermodesulfobacteriota bacterium]